MVVNKKLGKGLSSFWGVNQQSRTKDPIKGLVVDFN